MTIYKVRTGFKRDFYGYSTHEEEAVYFTDEAAAREFWESGGTSTYGSKNWICHRYDLYRITFDENGKGVSSDIIEELD